jgi:multisubunit Na+/H+ antiporter MnhG subunit
VPNVFQIEGSIFIVVSLLLLAVKIFALVTALMFSPDHYRAADKLTKPAWVAILGLGVAAQVLMPDVRGLINLAFTIAVFVYLADVRPALRSLHQR